MAKTRVEIIQSENKRSYGIKVHTDNTLNTGFIIPVIDVRDGENERRLANSIVKSANSRSKFMLPSFGAGGGSYNASYKK